VIESQITEVQASSPFDNTSQEKLKWQKSFPAIHDGNQATGTACITDPL
jgi:hypothetical protein